jgi:hypothetical protein
MPNRHCIKLCEGVIASDCKRLQVYASVELIPHTRLLPKEEKF